MTDDRSVSSLEIRPLHVARERYDVVRVVCGVLLVAVGLAVFFDRMYMVNAWVSQAARAF